MNRSQFLAALVVVGVLGALVVGRVQSGSSDETTDAASESAAPQSAADTAHDEAQDDGQESEAAPDEPLVVPEAPPILDDKPALVGIDGWINTDATSLDDFAGQVRVVEFWTFGCFNCKNTLPHLQALYERYGAEGLEIVGVHAPEFDYEADPTNVADALVDLNVTWPVALDTQKKNFRSWQSDGRRFWPRLYVVDSDGNIRFDHIGEGAYDELEETVSRLLNESA